MHGDEGGLAERECREEEEEDAVGKGVKMVVVALSLLSCDRVQGAVRKNAGSVAGRLPLWHAAYPFRQRGPNKRFHTCQLSQWEGAVIGGGIEKAGLVQAEEQAAYAWLILLNDTKTPMHALREAGCGGSCRL
jgi:hypothetical protein